MPVPVVERIKVIDADSHISEPPNLWTDRISSKWLNGGCREEHPEMQLLPSDYFKRQVYACRWFEEQSALKAIEQTGADN